MMPILTSLISVDRRSLDKVMHAGKTGPYATPTIAVATPFSTSEFTSQIVICIAKPVPLRETAFNNFAAARLGIKLPTSIRTQGQNRNRIK